MTIDLKEKLVQWRPSVPRSPADGAPLPTLRADGEEVMTEHHKVWKSRIHERVLKLLNLTKLEGVGEAEARSQIRDAAQRIMTEDSAPLSAAMRLRIAAQIEDEMLGLGPLEPLLDDRTISDILVNGPDQVYVERFGKLEPAEAHFRDEAHLRAIIDRIVMRVGRRIDEASPMVDARLADGSRVNAIIPPLAIDGALLSIRRFTVQRLSAEQLVAFGTINETIAKLLAAIVKARLNVLISGGTGSGKTTLLNVMSASIPVNERVLTIEDSAELQLQQPHVCRLETRPSNVEGRGEVTQRELVRNALRMRPDRIIVGEVRGGEAFDMLQAMNTGHDGSLTTVHANTPRDALGRIENMVTMAGVNLPVQTIRSQMASAINVVIQIERMEDGKRRVVSIQEIQGMEGQVVVMAEIFRFRRRGLDKAGGVIGQFEATGAVPRFLERMHQRGIDIGLDMFQSGNLAD
jgi:pilus assembly protein CpaF